MVETPCTSDEENGRDGDDNQENRDNDWNTKKDGGGNDNEDDNGDDNGDDDGDDDGEDDREDDRKDDRDDDEGDDGDGDEDGDDGRDDDGETKKGKGENSLKCPRCPKVVSRKSNLIRHFKTHMNFEVKCLCGARFRNVDHFDRHTYGNCRILKSKRDIHKKLESDILVLRQRLNIEATQLIDKEAAKKRGGGHTHNQQQSLSTGSLRGSKKRQHPDERDIVAGTRLPKRPARGSAVCSGIIPSEQITLPVSNDEPAQPSEDPDIHTNGTDFLGQWSDSGLLNDWEDFFNGGNNLLNSDWNHFMNGQN